MVALTGLPIGYSVIVALTGLPIGYSVIVALTGLPIGYSVIVALTGLPIGYSVIVALTGLPIGYSVIVALTGLPIGYSVIVALTGLPIGYSVILVLTGLPTRCYMLNAVVSDNDLILEFSLKFINGVIMVLFVDQDSPTVDCHHFHSSEQLVLPSYVSHFLYASRRRVHFVTVFELLKDIYRLTKGGKHPVVSSKSGLQQPLSMTAGISGRLINELDITIGCLASQHWLREKCLTHREQLWDKLTDRNLAPSNVRVYKTL